MLSVSNGFAKMLFGQEVMGGATASNRITGFSNAKLLATVSQANRTPEFLGTAKPVAVVEMQDNRHQASDVFGEDDVRQFMEPPAVAAAPEIDGVDVVIAALYPENDGDQMAAGPIRKYDVLELTDFDAAAERLVLAYDPYISSDPVVTVETAMDWNGGTSTVMIDDVPACRVTLAPGAVPVSADDVALVPEGEINELAQLAA